MTVIGVRESGKERTIIIGRGGRNGEAVIGIVACRLFVRKDYISGIATSSAAGGLLAMGQRINPA
jgi:hypothetical protein